MKKQARPFQVNMRLTEEEWRWLRGVTIAYGVTRTAFVSHLLAIEMSRYAGKCPACEQPIPITNQTLAVSE